MGRVFLTFLGAWGATTVIAAWTADVATPLWTALVGGLGAGFLAAAVVAMEEGFREDLLKGVIFAFIGGALLLMDLPGWVGWPLVLGPWAGFVGNRRRGGPGAE